MFTKTGEVPKFAIRFYGESNYYSLWSAVQLFPVFSIIPAMPGFFLFLRSTSPGSAPDKTHTNIPAGTFFDKI